MYTPKIAIIFDHIQEPQWLLSTVDYAWKTNQAEFFAFDKFNYKILPTNLGVYKPHFKLFIRHTWGGTVLFIIQTSDRIQYFTVFHDKLQKVNIQDDQSWAFSETVQKISKITYTASRFSLLTRAKFVLNINRVT